MAREYVLSYTVNGNAMRAGKMLNSEQDARDWALHYAESNHATITELYFIEQESGVKVLLDPLGEPVDADFEEVEEVIELIEDAPKKEKK
jgi:hypothetical protein